MHDDGRRVAVLLDACALWLEAVESVVRRLDFDEVHKATSCAQALAAVTEHQPHLLVTDLMVHSPDDGLDCIRRARAERPDLRTVVLSLSVGPELIHAALAEGAAAYVMKTAHPDDLLSAIRQAFDPSVYFADVAPRGVVQAAPSHGGDPSPRATDAVAVSLTRREREILRLVAEGHSNAQLARLLWVAEQTVKFHLSNVYRKLGVSNRTEAARWAQVHGLLSGPPSAPGVRLTAV